MSPIPSPKPGSARIALLHTAPSVVPALHSLCSTRLPEFEPFHLVDPALLTAAREQGITPDLTERVGELVELAVELGMEAVLVTCSSIGPCADVLQTGAPIPVLRIDAPMAAAAVRLAERIVLACTVESTATPSTELLQRVAAEAGRTVTVRSIVCPEAAVYWNRGTVGDGDACLRDALAAFDGWAQALVLAQASMAPAATRLQRLLRIPVLSSPESGILQIRTALAAGPEDRRSEP